MAVFNLLLDCENMRLSYLMKTSYICKKLSLYNFNSSNCLSSFEELKNGLPRYENKINKQPPKKNVIVLFNKNLKAFETNDGYLYNHAHLR